MEECSHSFEYSGVVNIAQGEVDLGVVDVWVCSKCKAEDVAARPLGDLGISVGLGFKPLSKEVGRWVVLVCRRGGSLSWEVLSLKSGEGLKHSCASPGVVEVDLDFALGDEYRGDHEFFLVEDYVNRTLSLK